MQLSQLTIIIADDDDDDRAMTEEAMRENHMTNPLRTVRDGAELMDYLRLASSSSDSWLKLMPALVLLDLNMPRMNGQEALVAMKADPRLRDIPVVVFTTSRAQEDVARSYRLGASSVITKPVRYGDLVAMMGTFGRYWSEVVDLPPP